MRPPLTVLTAVIFAIVVPYAKERIIGDARW